MPTSKIYINKTKYDLTFYMFAASETSVRHKNLFGWLDFLHFPCHGICRSLDELIKSRSVHLNRLAILVSINIKPQKHYLNMNPACSASLLMNDTDVRFH